MDTWQLLNLAGVVCALAVLMLVGRMWPTGEDAEDRRDVDSNDLIQPP